MRSWQDKSKIIQAIPDATHVASNFASLLVCIRSFLNWPASTLSPWCSHALFCSHLLNCAYAATLVRSQASLIDFFAGAQSQNMYWDLHTISSFLLKSKIPLWAGCSGFPSQGAGIHLAGTQSQKRSCQSHTNFSLLKSQMPLWVSLPGFTLQIHANPLIFTFRVATHRLHMLGEVASTLQVTKRPASGHWHHKKDCPHGHRFDRFNDEPTARLASPGWKRLHKQCKRVILTRCTGLLFPDSNTKRKNLFKKQTYPITIRLELLTCSRHFRNWLLCVCVSLSLLADRKLSRMPHSSVACLAKKLHGFGNLWVWNNHVAGRLQQTS